MRMPCGPRRRARLAVLACVLGLAAMAEARGDLTSYQYEGVITRADASTGVAAGARFSGAFAYDLAAGPSSAFDVPFGRTYEFSTTPASPGVPPATGMAAAVGGRSILQKSGDLSLSLYGPGAFGGGPGSPQTYLSLGASDSSGAGGISVQLLFLNSVQSVYPTLDAPDQINLGDFTAARFEVVQNLGRGTFLTLYEGTIDRLVPAVNPSAVPGPPSLLLLGTAAGGYLLRGRRRRAA